MVGGSVKILPKIEMNIGKNKISGFKNKLYFNFWPESSDFSGVKPEEAIAASEEIKGTKSVSESADKARYFELAEGIVSKGGKIGRAYYKFKEEFGYDPPFSWKEEFEGNKDRKSVV